MIVESPALADIVEYQVSAVYPVIADGQVNQDFRATAEQAVGQEHRDFQGHRALVVIVVLPDLVAIAELADFQAIVGHRDLVDIVAYQAIVDGQVNRAIVDIAVLADGREYQDIAEVE